MVDLNKKNPINYFFPVVLPPTPDEVFRYVLTFTDHYTKWPEFFPIKNKTAAEIAERIETFIHRWGAPERLLSDQGREFVNEVKN